jgi:glycosyltransferase involved in cell wall biosynthesis
LKAVSVVVPCYNCSGTIVRCVEAIFAGAHVPDEIVLVDDCSTDDTAEKLEGLARRHAGAIMVVSTERNGGPARARNRGAGSATGDYLFFLDSDTEVLPDALAKFLARIEECDAVVGMYDEVPLNRGIAPLYKALLYAWLLGHRGVQPYDQFSASCAGIKASVFRALGGYDDWFPPGLDFENEELGHRIAARYTMLLDPAIRARHDFPYHRKMARTFFQRTAFWVEMFVQRRKFSPTANTAATGLSSLALLVAVLAAPLALLGPFGFVLPAAAFAFYLYGYRGFFAYIARRRPRFLPLALALNLYYTLVIDCGAAYGAFKILTGRSLIAGRFGSN